MFDLYHLFNFMNVDQYVAVIGGDSQVSWVGGVAILDDRVSELSEVEAVRISDEGAVSPFKCQLPDLQVVDAAVANGMICGGKMWISVEWRDLVEINVRQT